MSSLPTLRRLLIFDSVMRLGSAGAAAAEIGLSQPAVTHALSTLEEDIGERLLDRGPGGSYGTRAGQILHRRVERMLRQIEAGVADLAPGAVTDPAHVARALTSTQVRCHIAIAERGSFRAAAQQLGVAEPTLHRAARDLERAVRAPLYRRILHGVAATVQGLAFANRLKLALREIAQALDELEVERGQAGGRISVGCLPLLPKWLLARAIGRLLKEYPNVRVEVEEAAHDTLLPGLRDGGFDLMIGALRDPLPGEDVAAVELFDDPYVVVAREGHPLTRKRRVAEADLADYSWVVPRPEMPRHAIVETLFQSLPRRPRVALETSSLVMMIATLVESDCLTLLSRAQALQERPAAGPRLAILPAALPGSRRAVGILTRAGWLPTRVQQNFLAFLREECGALDGAEA